MFAQKPLDKLPVCRDWHIVIPHETENPLFPRIIETHPIENLFSHSRTLFRMAEEMSDPILTN